jgi:hypothetical protein
MHPLRQRLATHAEEHVLELEQEQQEIIVVTHVVNDVQVDVKNVFVLSLIKKSSVSDV